MCEDKGKDSFFVKLYEKYIDLYDRSYLYFFAFFLAIATIIGKAAFEANQTADLINKFGPGSIGSYFIIGGSLLIGSLLLWYNYISTCIADLNFAISDTNKEFLIFLKDRYRFKSNIIFVAISHIVFLTPSIILLGYYNYEVGIFRLKPLFFSVVVKVSLLLYLYAIYYRIATIKYIWIKWAEK